MSRKLTPEQVAIHGAVLKALKKPMRVMRGRHKKIEAESECNAKLLEKIKTQTPHIDGVLTIINLMAAEALFLLDKRTRVVAPKHFDSIHQALTIVEQLTTLDMGKKTKDLIYSQSHIDGVLAKMSPEYYA